MINKNNYLFKILMVIIEKIKYSHLIKYSHIKAHKIKYIKQQELILSIKSFKDIMELFLHMDKLVQVKHIL